MAGAKRLTHPKIKVQKGAKIGEVRVSLEEAEAVHFTVNHTRVKDVEVRMIGKATKVYKIGDLHIYVHRDRMPAYHVVM